MPPLPSRPLLLGLALLDLSACGNMPWRDHNTAAGAVIGGAAVGGMIGRRADPEKDKK